MFRKQKMAEALTWLLKLYTSEDYDGLTMETLLDFAGFDMEETCLALRNHAGTVFEYSVSGDEDYSFEYRGKELFSQRAVRIARKEMFDEESDTMELRYSRELWLCENMTFSVVRCVHMVCTSEDNRFATEYRAIEKDVEGREELFISPDVLIESLMLLCIPVWEDEAIIYEL